MRTNRNGFNTLDELISGEVRAEIARKKLPRKTLYDSIGMHPNVFNRKYNGLVGFTSSELASVARLLGTTAAEITRAAEARLESEVAA